jgi:hypothetical protein
VLHFETLYVEKAHCGGVLPAALHEASSPLKLPEPSLPFVNGQIIKQIGFDHCAMAVNSFLEYIYIYI